VAFRLTGEAQPSKKVGQSRSSNLLKTWKGGVFSSFASFDFGESGVCSVAMVSELSLCRHQPANAVRRDYRMSLKSAERQQRRDVRFLHAFRAAPRR